MLPWIEKYRPNSLDELIADEDTIKKFTEFIESKNIPHLLFTGGAGQGKTTSAKILAKSITDEYLYINSSDETSVETIRTKVKSFCSTMGFGDLKIVILDECDALSPNAQMMLRNVMEEFAKSSRFILTCNYNNKLIDPVKSRTQIFRFDNSNKNEIYKRIAKILKEEKVTFDKNTIRQQIVKIVDKFYPDIRKIIGTLEKFTNNGVFNFNEKMLEDLNFDIIQLLKDGQLSEIRKTIIGSVDYEILYKILFDESEKIKEECSIDIKLCVAEYLYRHSIIIDQEINFMGCLYQITQIINEGD